MSVITQNYSKHLNEMNFWQSKINRFLSYQNNEYADSILIITLFSVLLSKHFNFVYKFSDALVK